MVVVFSIIEMLVMIPLALERGKRLAAAAVGAAGTETDPTPASRA